MSKTIAHIAIAVRSIEASRALFSRLLGVSPGHEELVPGQGVRTAFFQVGGTAIELLEGTGEESPVTRFIAKRGEGIHHVSLEVDDVAREMERLRGEGFEFVDDHPRPGADNTLVAFLHPRSTNGVLIEISQKRG